MGRPDFKSGETRTTRLVGSTPTLFRQPFEEPGLLNDTGNHRELVLVGGGHAHVEVLRRFAVQPQRGVRLTLVARDVLTPYSGMLPGHLAGHYGRDECHIDLTPLARHAGARLIHTAVTGIDAERRMLRCADRPDLYYDLLSLDTGSTASLRGIEGADRHGITVKPVDAFLRRLGELERQVLRTETVHRLVVVGGGAGGVEVSLCLQHRLRSLLRAHDKPEERLSVTLVTASGELLPQHAESVRRRFERVLAARGIEVHRGLRVTRIGPESMACEPYRLLPADSCVLLTDAAAPDWLVDSGLELDERGFVRVDRHLRSLSHPQVFAAGDVAAFAPWPLLKNGVYAVRQGPLLAGNLRAALLGGRLRPFRPQARTLALISTGDRRAVASWRGQALAGWWLWRLKDRIDRRFMRRYSELPPMPESAAMRCGGCGAKTGAEVLRSVLDSLPPPACGETTGRDDAAVFEVPAGRLLVQSVDHFPSFIDDPWLFGRITAAHCLNDLYAMGAEPHSALAMVTLPLASGPMQAADLRALLEGAIRTLGEAGADLRGGHTAEGTEFGFGLAVTGHAAPGSLLTRAGLLPGDRLLLTKPLGTGIVLAGHMRARCGSRELEQTLLSMQQSNRAAVELLRAHGVRACTDVSGFGLLGHLGEMLEASGTHALLESRALPALRGAQALSAAGIASTAAPANRAAAVRFGVTDRDEHADALLFDPQTGGGLLAGVARERAEDCVRDLRAAGYAQTCIIGEVTDGAAGQVTLLPASPRT